MKQKLEALYLYVDKEEASTRNVDYRWAMSNVREMLEELFPEEVKEFKETILETYFPGLERN